MLEYDEKLGMSTIRCPVCHSDEIALYGTQVTNSPKENVPISMILRFACSRDHVFHLVFQEHLSEEQLKVSMSIQNEQKHGPNVVEFPGFHGMS